MLCDYRLLISEFLFLMFHVQYFVFVFGPWTVGTGGFQPLCVRDTMIVTLHVAHIQRKLLQKDACRTHSVVFKRKLLHKKVST